MVTVSAPVMNILLPITDATHSSTLNRTCIEYNEVIIKQGEILFNGLLVQHTVKILACK